MRLNNNWLMDLFMVLLTGVIVIFISIEWMSQRDIPVTEHVHPIQAVTCVQSEYWICDIRIDDEVILGHRSPVELHVGDPMVVFVKDDSKYLFNL